MLPDGCATVGRLCLLALLHAATAALLAFFVACELVDITV